MFSLLSAVPTKSDDPSGVWILDVRWGHRRSTWRPPTDVFETPHAIVVRVEIAGMQPDDFRLELDGQVLYIYGQRNDPDAGIAYHRLEIPFGPFQIAIALPASVDETDVKAEYRDGFLRVFLPKRASRVVRVHHHT